MNRPDIRFAWPQLGRPHFPLGPGPLVTLPEASVSVYSEGPTAPDQLVIDEQVRIALDGRLALVPVGGGDPMPLEIGPAASAQPSDGGWLSSIPVTASPLPRQLYDVATRTGDGPWEVVAPHAVYHRPEWSDLGVAHISDTHVARRIDGFRPTLRAMGRDAAAERFINWNDRFRGFVRYANALHAQGRLDVIVATGDLIDYQFENGDDQSGTGNAGFLRKLVLGQAPGPDFADVAELRVPILMTPGNHDYRRNPYRLVFDIHLAGFDLHRVHNHSGFGLSTNDAAALENALRGKDDDSVPNIGQSSAEAMVAVDPTLRSFRTALADPEPQVVALGQHRIVLLDSAHDVGMVTSVGDALRAWLGTLDENEATFVGGSPNCEGVSDAEYAVALSALENAPADGVVLFGLHAPLVNVWNAEYPYFLRETQRPVQSSQAWWFLARHTHPLYKLSAGAMADAHPQWFSPGDGLEPAYLKRGDTQDLLDFGVSRGRADDLVRAIVGSSGGGTRGADAVLAGHTHAHNEMTLRPVAGGGLAYHLDFYTQNPRRYYPTRFVTRDDAEKVLSSGLGNPMRYRVGSSTTAVLVDDEALPQAEPWAVPRGTRFDHVVQVPPYADPLDRATDARAWWSRHRPLILQTGALGPRESDQVSFSGFRLLSIAGGVIERVHNVSMKRLEQHGFDLPLEQAAAAEPPPIHRHRERSRRHGTPSAQGAPCIVAPGTAATHSVVYRDGDGFLVELWEVPGSTGGGRLAGRDVTPAAAGNPLAFSAGGLNVVVYRGSDDHIHSLYWSGTEPARHDALSQSAGGPTGLGDPTAYELGGMTHVVYRTRDGSLEELAWVGEGAVSHTRITGYAGEPAAAGDPCAYGVPSGLNVVVYRGVDGHVHSLYWSDGPTGHDDLSGYVGMPLAAGEPVAYFNPRDGAHQVVYRDVSGHLQEIWWVGESNASGWDLTAVAGAPPAATDPGCCYVPESNLKHVVYVGSDGHVIDLAWTPGGGVPSCTDLTLSSLAPLGADRPAVFTLPGSAQVRVVYRGRDNEIHEIQLDGDSPSEKF